MDWAKITDEVAYRTSSIIQSGPSFSRRQPPEMSRAKPSFFERIRDADEKQSEAQKLRDDLSGERLPACLLAQPIVILLTASQRRLRLFSS